DLLFTKMLYAALRTIDVALMEHIIIGKDEYFSFYKQDLLLKYGSEYDVTYNTLGVAKTLLTFKQD
ncbi:MAG: hypothetical protein IJ999_06450, partial [Clostridia bacterium]|nr:hypothetical protein [Clostridia bacterium]